MDQKSYQKMFDQIHMPAQRAGEVRRELAARCSWTNRAAQVSEILEAAGLF